MYLCTKFHAFVQICTFIPLTALTNSIESIVTFRQCTLDVVLEGYVCVVVELIGILVLRDTAQ